MDSRPLFIGNWKMHFTEAEVTTYLNRFKPLVFGTEGPAVALAPAFTSLKTASILTENTGIYIAAQDVSSETEGAFTGQVSASMLAAVGCRFVLVGHSERRRDFAEDDKLARKKLMAAMAQRLSPVLCVGETTEDRAAGRAEEVVERQVRGALDGITVGDDAPLDVAYEPVWAIGTGQTATSDQAETMHRKIRSVLESLYPAGAGEGIRVLYGGSVTPENAAELMAQPSVAGLLVGGAALDPERFAAICKVAVRSVDRAQPGP